MIITVTIALIIANLYFSYQGFQNQPFREKYLFHIEPIMIGKEYTRLLSAGFLHVDWMHLILNMYTLYIFSDVLKNLDFVLGKGFALIVFLFIYFGSLIGGNLLALFIHRNHGDYRALGASGAVSGVMFACIAWQPYAIKIFGFIDGWLFGILYTLVTIYGVKSRWGNIGHEAHLGGSMVGVACMILLMPEILSTHLWVILAISLPMIAFLYIMVYRPEVLMIPNYTRYKSREMRSRIKTVTKSKGPKAGKKRYISKEAELNALLDKVKKVGYPNLTEQEKNRLEILSREMGE